MKRKLSWIKHSKILNKCAVQEESFPPDCHETAILKPWQAELMKHIDNPSDRKRLWVQGEKW